MTITKQSTPVKAPTRPRWRPALAAATAGILVLIVIGIAALIGFTGGDSGPAESPTSIPAVESTLPPVTETTLPAQTTLPETVPATLLDGSWTHRQAETAFVPRGVIGPGLLETNFGFFTTENQDEIWLSADGTEWSKVLALPRGEPIDEVALEPGQPPNADTPPTTVPDGPAPRTVEAYIRALVEYDGAAYAFANILELEDPRSPNNPRRQVAYRSFDGTEWEEIILAHDMHLGTAAAGENELVAILDGNEASVAMWSTDGTVWTRHETGFSLDNETLAYVNGEYLAVAIDNAFSGSDEYPWGKKTMVRSADGITWEEIPGSEFPFNAFPRDLMEYEGKLYMDGLVFKDGDTHGMIFWSDDGRVWQQAELPDLSSLRFVNQLIPNPRGLLALGESIGYEDATEPDRGVLMTTLDGSTFVEIPHEPGLFEGAPENTRGYSLGERIILYGIDYQVDQVSHVSVGPPIFHEWTWTPDS